MIKRKREKCGNISLESQKVVWSLALFGVLAVGSVGVPMFTTLHNDHHFIGWITYDSACEGLMSDTQSDCVGWPE